MIYIYIYLAQSSMFFFSLYQKQEPIKKKMVSRLSYWWTPSWSFEFMVFFVPVMSGWFLTRLKQEKDRTSYWWAMSTGFITISSNHNGQILVDYEQRAGNGLKNSIWKLWWFQILLDKTYQLVSNPWPCISFTLPIWSHEPWLPMRWCWRCVNPSDSRWWGLQGLTWVRENCPSQTSAAWNQQI